MRILCNGVAKIIIAVCAIFVLLSQTAYSAESGKFPAKKVLGVVVTNENMTLYTYDIDEAGSGKSACNTECAAQWKPFAAAADATDIAPFSVITRTDGAKQWTIKGKPLYLYTKDEKPGDVSGDNKDGVWHIIVQ